MLRLGWCWFREKTRVYDLFVKSKHSRCIVPARLPCSRVTQATRDHAGAGVRQAGHQPGGAARAAAPGRQVRAPALAHLRLQVGGGGGE